jgi:predicted site-specific integrase-resolvase
MATLQAKPERATFDVYEAAAILGVNHKVIRRYVQQGVLPKLDTRRILIPKNFFLRWVESGAPSTVAD